MDKKEILVNLKALNSAISDYLDRMDMAEVDEKECKKECRKEPAKKGKED